MSYGFDKTKISDLDKKKVKILNYQLAFENYEDNTSKKLDELSKINHSLKKLRNDNLSDTEANILADETLALFDKLYHSLSKDEQTRFVFYEDESIGYLWTIEKKKEKY